MFFPILQMETYLVDVSKLRIPRPKFATSTGTQSGRCCGPREPPRDYNMEEEYSNSSQRAIKLQSDTEDIRQAIQEKL